MNRASHLCWPILTISLCIFGESAFKANASELTYDPLLTGETQQGDERGNEQAEESSLNYETIDVTTTGDILHRPLPLSVHIIKQDTPRPVVLFSHGLGGSRHGSNFLGKHLANRGYVAVFIQHPGSDTEVWIDKKPEDRRAALESAANLQNYMKRALDIPRVIDQLAMWNLDVNHPLHNQMDMGRIGMSGHSFGAMTTQAVSGQQFALLGKTLTDERILASIIYSPSAPRRGDVNKAFGKVSIPWLLMTGTHDIAGIGAIEMADRLAVYPALPGNNHKYELVLDEAEHSVFTDRRLPGESKRRNPNHHRVILAITTAFWDAWLKGDKTAMQWLNGEGVTSVLEPGDRWQHD